MTNLLKTIVPKSDQLNADDLIGQTKTITINRVSLLSDKQQPVAIGYEGDEGKPYKPCLSMRRVLIQVWGDNGNAYIGRSLTLYRDEKVRYGGAEVGGIRISHMSDITAPITLALTATKASRKPFTVRPLVVNELPVEQQVEQINAATTSEELRKIFAQYYKKGGDNSAITEAYNKRKTELTIAKGDI